MGTLNLNMGIGIESKGLFKSIIARNPKIEPLIPTTALNSGTRITCKKFPKNPAPKNIIKYCAFDKNFSKKLPNNNNTNTFENRCI